MPRKCKTAASTAQNRESQRRSRVRRKELVDDLRRRLDEYERRGTAASLELQAAAKAVHAENAQLRVLLEMHGVSRQQVDRHLASVGSAGTGDAGDKQHVHPPEESRRAGEVGESSKNRRYWPRHGRQQQQERREQPTSVLSEPNVSQGSAISSSSLTSLRTATTPQGTQLDRPPEAVTKPPERPPASLETSCDRAAAILVQLHHQTDPERARAALGCAGTSSCSVKNLRMFQLMDTLLG